MQRSWGQSMAWMGIGEVRMGIEAIGDILRTLAFILNEIESLWSIFKRTMTWSECFQSHSVCCVDKSLWAREEADVLGLLSSCWKWWMPKKVELWWWWDVVDLGCVWRYNQWTLLMNWMWSVREREASQRVGATGRLTLPFFWGGKGHGKHWVEKLGVCFRTVGPMGSHQDIHGVQSHWLGQSSLGSEYR